MIPKKNKKNNYYAVEKGNADIKILLQLNAFDVNFKNIMKNNEETVLTCAQVNIVII